jgi:hypothetical protein
MREILSENGETREFLVFPPAGLGFDAASKLREIAEELARSFPDMKFTVMTHGEPREERGFKLMPLLGAADSNKPMLQWPSIDVLETILSCLAGFIVQAEKEAKPQLH